MALANPPYIQLQRNEGASCASLYQDKDFAKPSPVSGDVYQLFYERGCQMLSEEPGLC